jgi:hypothetical protein
MKCRLEDSKGARRKQLFVASRLRGCVFIMACSLSSIAFSQPAEVLAQIQVQGNTITPDADVLAIAGLTIGMPVEAGTPAAAAARLEADGRFDRVDVLKRFASIENPSRIALIVIVHEPGARILDGRGGPARVVRRRGSGLQYLPLVRFEDGYGWTYGLQASRPNVFGGRSRLAFPLTWGGERQAAAIAERTFPDAPITLVQGGASLTRRVHPYFETPEHRGRIWMRVERAFGSSLRLGATADHERVTLGNADDGTASVDVDATLDTRVDPWLARNAVFARAAWQRARFPSGPVDLTDLDASGYLGLPRGQVLVVRVHHQGADAPLPAYAQRMLGGMDSVRGLRRGTAVGDNAMTGSLELRVPLSSPLTVAKIGVNAFVDWGTVYDHGQRLRDQSFAEGVGGGAWLSLAVLRLNVSAAHVVGGSTRVQFGATLGF